MIIKGAMEWLRRQLRITTKWNRFCNSDVCLYLYKDAAGFLDVTLGPHLESLEVAGRGCTCIVGGRVGGRVACCNCGPVITQPVVLPSVSFLYNIRFFIFKKFMYI
jgi:hypothetical protein